MLLSVIIGNLNHTAEVPWVGDCGNTYITYPLLLCTLAWDVMYDCRVTAVVKVSTGKILLDLWLRFLYDQWPLN